MDLNKSEIDCHWIKDQVRQAISFLKLEKASLVKEENRISFMNLPFQTIPVN